MDDFKDKVAFVTGAASGIGLGISRALANAGMRVAMADIESEPLEKAALDLRKVSPQVEAYTLDVSDRAAVYDVAEKVKRSFGRLDILVNNAGVRCKGHDLLDVKDVDYDWVIGVNFLGVVYGIKAFVPLIRESGGGHVVNTASIGGLMVPGQLKIGLYSATKSAVVTLSEALLGELAPHGIGVSVLCPGAVNTQMIRSPARRPPRFGTAEKMAPRVVDEFLKDGLDPDVVGRRVLEAIKDDEFYILTHQHYRGAVEERYQKLMKAFDKAASMNLTQG